MPSPLTRLPGRLLTSAVLALLVLATQIPAHAAKTRDAAKPRPDDRDDSRPALDPKTLEALQWREVGPYRGGRSAAVAGVPGQPGVYYFGGTGGGVWKTTDGGRTWKNVSDGFFGGSIGAVAVSAWDPNVVYAGGGESTVRGNVSHGNGVWKSTDAGKTWKHVGLADSRQIPRIRIHPKNPDLVYVAALGHLFGPNEMRGVYRSADGGATWKRILYAGGDAGANAGAIDLAMDPTNPRVLYATLWRVRRTPWGFDSGGPGSGLWKSTDGGDTWTELSHNPGLPKGALGIAGIDVSPTNPENLYAIVEAQDGGVFRSKDGGKTWTRTNESRDLRQRAWYYSRIYADPADEESVYVVNVRFHHSKDGGKTFTGIRTPHGDNHDLWIAPEDPKRMIEANDGGVNVSTDGGATWTSQANQPTAQIYRVSTDNHFPYRILGAQQDNSTLRIASRGQGSGIGPADWQESAGGESGYVVADPTDPEVVYGGSYGGLLIRLDHRTGEARDVNPWPDNPMGWGAAEIEHRFQWNFPIFFSPNDPKKLYTASQYLLESTDGGQSWRRISPDLTRNDKSKQIPSGGPITKDNTSVEYYCTIFTAAESPLAPGVLWAGSDDGLVHVSRDGGQTWKDVTPKGLPEWAMINSIEASPYEKGGAYFAATRYKLDDFHPYLYRTTDYGETWTRIDAGIDPSHFTRVVRADPARRGLLYAGTEQGLYVSWDDGRRWQPLQLNLPIVPVTDLTLKDDDLIAATQGRGFWVLDDLAPLRQLTPEMTARPRQTFQLLTPEPAWRLSGGGGGDGDEAQPAGQGKNPPAGVVVDYWLASAPAAAAPVKLEFLDRDGKVIRTFTGKAKAEAEPGKDETRDEAKQAGDKNTSATAGEEDKEEESEQRGDRDGRDKEPEVTAKAGLNRFVWDLRYPAAGKFPGLILWNRGLPAPMVVPGDYQVRLTVGSDAQTARFAVRKHPSSKVSQEDLDAQFRFVSGIRDKITEAHDAVRRIREVHAQLDDLRQRLRRAQKNDAQASGAGDAGDTADAVPANKELLDAAKALDQKMTEVEKALYQTQNKSPQDPLNFPIRLTDKLSSLAESAATGDYPPTAQAIQVRDRLVSAVDEQLAKLRKIWNDELPAFNKTAASAGVQAVIVPAPRLQ